MESKNKIPPAGVENIKKAPIRPSRRDFLGKTAFLGTTVLASPLAGMAEKISPDESGGNTEYEQFVVDQINEIKEIVANKKYRDILSNPYLAYCLYYLQSFLDQTSDPKNQRSVPEKIIGAVAHLITPEFRAQAILSLEEQTKDKERLEDKKISANKVLPLKKFIFGSIGKNHEIAIDLFTNESSPVYSTGGGLVIVADNDWHPDSELSSSSIQGGNTVIIFNYLTKEFFRYAHLNKIAVSPGELVMAGENLGTVGHTGKNASLPGHGQHLHFEIRRYLSDKNINQPLMADDLKKLLGSLTFNSLVIKNPNL